MSTRLPSFLAAHYLRLGLTPPASREQLSKAYRVAALKHHPDRGGDAIAFKAVTDSYNALLHHQGNLNRAYRPASLRSYVDAERSYSSFEGVATAILLPSLIGVIVGIRLVYFGNQRDGLRAGGTSRFIPLDPQPPTSSTAP